MDTERSWAVLISIRKEHAEHILTGQKTVELRKTVPAYIPTKGKALKYPFRAYIYEPKNGGGCGAIVGFFDCPGYIGTKGDYMESMAKDAMVTLEQLKAYGKDGWVYAWKVCNPTRFAKPVPLSVLEIGGFTGPPQSWYYLGPKIYAHLLEEIGEG